MNSILKGGLIFTTGLGIGAAVSWFVTKRVCDEQRQNEIKEVVKSFAQLQKDNEEKAELAKNKPDILTVAKAMQVTEQQEEPTETKGPEGSSSLTDIPIPKTNYAKIPEGNVEEPKPAEEEKKEETIEPADPPLGPANTDADTKEPYILNRPPHEDDEPFYTVITVMYYMDGTYADTHGREMEIEEYIGRKMMEYIEKSKDDEIFIRNDELELDFDIVKDARTYDEVMFG